MIQKCSGKPKDNGNGGAQAGQGGGVGHATLMGQRHVQLMGEAQKCGRFFLMTKVCSSRASAKKYAIKIN